MRYQNKILLSDMDGTLLDSKGNVSNENKTAIQYFVEQGGRFGVATGRNQLNSLKYLEGIHINAPSILYNGGAMYEYSKKEFLSYSELYKGNLINVIMWCLQECPEVMIQIYELHKCYIVSPIEYADQEILDEHTPYELASIYNIIDKPWIKILFYSDRKNLGNISDKIEDMGLVDKLSLVYSSEVFLEVLPKGISKGNMLSEYRRMLGEEYVIYAVGDYYNDVEMLKLADVGIAADNAPEDVKQAADQVGMSNDNSVIAHVIYHIIGT